MGLSGGQVVSVLTIYCDSLSSNPAEIKNIFCNNDFKKNKIVLTTNILGQEVDQNYRALIITYYSDGSFIKL